MKRYRFPLASVLRIRKVEEDQAVAALAEAERRRVAAAEAAERRRAAHEQIRPEPGLTSVDAFLAGRQRLERSAAAVRASQEELSQAHMAIAARRAALAAAASARGALEQLDERRRAEHALESQREEDREVDDLVNGRFQRGRP